MLENFHAEDILLHMLNAVILFVIVRFLVYKPIHKFMQGRAARIEDSLEEAAQARQTADTLRATYEQKMAAAEDAARERALEITASANESVQAMTDAAKLESIALLDKARATALEERGRALSGLQDEMVDLSIGIAEQILRREVNREDSVGLAQDYLNAQTTLRTVQNAMRQSRETQLHEGEA